ncbi:electron transport complex subunit RsxC, partial [Nitrincola sp. A-D6]|uniref:electron transport complex subunit RsxC n=1 Tax=Nitrincola sp. A-D6 TaxID=1545442 RepID=UPI002E12747C
MGLQPVPHASGLESPCIVIETDGEDRWIERELLPDYHSVSKKTLIRHIRESGIAGLGGAGFPTDIKLNLGQDHIVNTLIINAAECEPYITADDALMRERPDEILSGIEIIAHILEPSHTLIGIEDNKPNAIKALREAIRKRKLPIDLMVVPTRYPSGGEKQLIQLLTDVEIPSGSIPADIGIVCQNVGTAAAVYRAVELGEPLISRIVTLTGFALGHRQNYEVLIGTPFSTLLESAEVDRSRLFRLVMGGPMMGISVEDDRIPVIKTTNCIIAATREEMPPTPPAQPCIRCGMCEQVCPASLLPQQLYWFAKGREFDKARHHNLFDCIECGACAYVCPSNIPLVQHYRFAKSEIRNEQAEQLKAAQARERFEARQARLAREVEEKELRRKERAEAAALEQARKKADADIIGATQPDPEAELKKLKTAASIARTKLKKARDALKNAREKGLEGTDKLEATVIQLEQSAETAKEAWQR